MDNQGANVDVNSPARASTSNENDDDNICLICEKELTAANSRRLGLLAQESTVAASKRRMDNKFQKMVNCTPLIVHKNCYTNYVKESLIARAVKQIKKNKETVRKIADETVAFNFVEACFICQKTEKKNMHRPSGDDTITKMIARLQKKKI